MKKIFLTIALLVSTQAHSSLLSSALFSTSKEAVQAVTKQAWSCEKVKETVCNAISTTLEPLTTFAYDNMTLAAGTAITVAYVAYKAGKFVHMPVYKQEDVQKVMVIAQAPNVRAPRPNRG